MPRKNRIKSSTDIYHIIWRGVAKENVFREDKDYIKFLYILKEAKEKFDIHIYAYCLMTNHIHMLVKSRNVSSEMKWIGLKYALWFNIKYERAGHLFQDRFLSEAVENDPYFVTVVRYIHQNPVKAGMCKSVGEYRWSSYGAYFEDGKLVDRNPVLGIMNIKQFIEFNNEFAEDRCLEVPETAIRVTDEMAEDMLKEILVRNNRTHISELNDREKAFVFKRLVDEHVTVRQIERIAGVGRSHINRLLK